jgi:cell division protein FtsA
MIAALDVGSHKISCLIARVSPRKQAHLTARFRGDDLEVVGIGHNEAHGLRNGAVVDMAAAEQAIRKAVDAAERDANIRLEKIFVNISGGLPKSRRYSAAIDVAGRAVTAEDMKQVLLKARGKVDTGRRLVLHAAPIGYAMDGHGPIANPQGMFGERLSTEISVVSVLPGPMRNLAHCINRCHLTVAGFALAPFASGLSVLVEDEMDLGVTLIDLGAGTTSAAVFYEGHLVYADVLPVGGAAVTQDIACGLSTPLAHAERVKTLYGSALASLSDDRELITVPLLGERGRDGVSKLPRSMLTGIIQPRLEETFEMVRDRLETSGYAALAGRRVVLSGGASQMVGVRELASSILGRKVRLAEPVKFNGLSGPAAGPAVAAACGLLIYGRNPQAFSAVKPRVDQLEDPDMGYFRRVGRWLKQSF